MIRVDAVVDIPENEDRSSWGILPSWDNGVHSVGRCLHIVVVLHVLQQIQAELIEAQVHDGDPAGHLLDVHDLLLEPLQLLSAIFQIPFFFGVDGVIIAGGGQDGDLHAGLHPAFQIDVFVQVHIRPEVHQLDYLIPAADAVDPAKPLDDADRVPMDVVVDEVVTILKVLALGDTVCGDQNVSPRART